MLVSLAAVALLLLASAADAVRDAWIRKDWWPRHIIKWLAFYPPLLWILVREVPPLWWVGVIPAAWLVWRLAARYIGGVTWQTHWARIGQKESNMGRRQEPAGDCTDAIHAL